MSELTQAKLDEIYQRLIGEPGQCLSPGRPRFVVVVSRYHMARIENEGIRRPRRLARRKAHGGRKT